LKRDQRIIALALSTIYLESTTLQQGAWSLVIAAFLLLKRGRMLFVQLNIILPILFVLICVFLLVLSFISAPIETLTGTGITLTGIPVYLLFVVWADRHPQWLKKWRSKCCLRVEMREILAGGLQLHKTDFFKISSVDR